MLKVILLMVYLWTNPDKSVTVKVDQIPMPDLYTCETAGPARIEKLVADPRFVLGLHASCQPLTITQS